MGKLLVNKETFKALVDVINRNGEDRTMELHAEAPTAWQSDWSALNSLSIPDMAKAIYVGYELKQTPEESILSFYKAHERMANSGDYDTMPEGKAVCGAVNFVLNHLEIEIEGINK